jgi:hypothetical protein
VQEREMLRGKNKRKERKIKTELHKREEEKKRRANTAKAGIFDTELTEKKAKEPVMDFCWSWCSAR